MNEQQLRASIIERVRKEKDLDRLEAILKLMETSDNGWRSDSGLLSAVMEAEEEYKAGKGMTLEAAKKYMKRLAGK